MQFKEVLYTDARPIDGYGPGFFRVGGAIFHGPVIVSDSGVAPWGGYADAEPLLSLCGKVDVLFIGTGAEIAHLPADLRDRLEAVEIGVEIMSSPSAARTYNVLLAEGRRVAVALLPVGTPAEA